MASLVEVRIKGGLYRYELEGPYNFKSGKHEGRSVEAMMFSNRSDLTKLKCIRDSNLRQNSQPDKLHLHLAWILNAGEFVQSSEICPHCSDERRTVKYFSVRVSGGRSAFGLSYICCGGEACTYKLLTDEKVHILPLKFSSLSHFRNTEQREAGAFLKDLLMGTDKLDPKKAFQMFLSSTSNVVQL